MCPRRLIGDDRMYGRSGAGPDARIPSINSLSACLFDGGWR
jgi:hypothetical protein